MWPLRSSTASERREERKRPDAVVFTGRFQVFDRSFLEHSARAKGWRIMRSVGVATTLVVAGPRDAGAAVIAAAAERNIPVIDESTFIERLHRS